MSLPSACGGACDRLAIGDGRRSCGHLDAEHTRQSLDRDRDVGLAEAAKDRRAAGPIDQEGLVLGEQPPEGGRELGVVGLGRRGEADRVDGLAVRQRRGPCAAVRARPQHRSRRRPRQLGDRPDLAGAECLDRHVLGTAKAEECRNPLFDARRRVAQAVARPKCARQHLEHRDLADERIGDGAEHVHDRLALGARGDADLGAVIRLGAAPDDDARVVISGRRRERAQQVEDAVDARAGEARAQQDGHCFSGGHFAGEGGLELARGRFAAVEVRLELRIVVRHDVFGDADVQVVLLGLGRRRHRLLAMVPGVVVDEGVLAEHVGDGVEVLFLAERQLERPQVVAERGAQVGDDAAEVRARAILLRDDEDAGHARLLSCRPHRTGARGDAVDRAHHDGGDIRHGQRGVDTAHEVGMSGCVHERDGALAAVVARPGHVGERDAECRLARDLFGVVVTDRGALLDRAAAWDDARSKQQSLCEGGLAGTGTADEGDRPMRRTWGRIHPGPPTPM